MSRTLQLKHGLAPLPSNTQWSADWLFTGGAEDTDIEFSSAYTFYRPLACVASIASRSWKVEGWGLYVEGKLSVTW